MTQKQLLLVYPRGFCGGVTRAVEVLNRVIKRHGSPIYVKHQLVHNRRLIKDFEKKGVVFIDDIEEIPRKAVTVFSAHGSSPKDYQRANEKELILYDATCPLVTKVHFEAKNYEKAGYYILYIGHQDHPEPKGVLAEVLPESCSLVRNINDAKKVIPKTDKLVVLSQTTLSFDETKEIIKILKKRFPKLIQPLTFDICYATQNRQKAVKELAKKVCLIIIVGSKESSNSNRLREIAEEQGVKSFLVDDHLQVKKDWFKGVDKVGLSAGASAPEYLIKEITEHIRKLGYATRKLLIIKENISLPLPKIYEDA